MNWNQTQEDVAVDVCAAANHHHRWERKTTHKFSDAKNWENNQPKNEEKRHKYLKINDIKMRFCLSNHVRCACLIDVYDVEERRRKKQNRESNKCVSAKKNCLYFFLHVFFSILSQAQYLNWKCLVAGLRKDDFFTIISHFVPNATATYNFFLSTLNFGVFISYLFFINLSMLLFEQ